MGEFKQRHDTHRAGQPDDAEISLQEAMSALDLLERYFNQPPTPCGRAVDAVLRLRQMACSPNAMPPDKRKEDRMRPPL
jgi:hypothetical protein